MSAARRVCCERLLQTALAKSSLVVAPLSRAARLRQRLGKANGGGVKIAPLELKFGSRGGEKRVAAESVEPHNLLDRSKASVRPMLFAHRDRPIESDDRARPLDHEKIVEPHDPCPVRVLRVACAGMGRGKRRLDMVPAQLAARGGKFEQTQALLDLPSVPHRAVLAVKRHEFACRIDSGRK